MTMKFCILNAAGAYQAGIEDHAGENGIRKECRYG